MQKIPRGIYFVNDKAVCCSPEVPPAGAVQKVMQIPTDHYDFFGPIDFRGKTEAEIQAEADALMEVRFKHQYSVTICPNCHNKLTPAGGVIIEFLPDNGPRSRIKSQLDVTGRLVDVEGIVAKGWHCDTLCSECEEALNEYEIF